MPKFCPFFIKCEEEPLLLRHVTPLPRRNVVYFCSAVYILIGAAKSGEPQLALRAIRQRTVTNAPTAEEWFIINSLAVRSLHGLAAPDVSNALRL
jgi:hypothetical protein